MPTAPKAVKPRQENTSKVPKEFTVRLLGTVGDLGRGRVFIMTEGNIKDMLRVMDTHHPGNKGLEAFLRLAEKEMFTPDKEA